MGFIEEALMPKWNVSFTDDHGESVVEQFECEQKPTLEEAARLVRARVSPVLKELDLNDLEGRIAEPTVKILKDQNSIKDLKVDPAA
ncbi:hypothetical protein [Pseudomonas sp. ATCC PTA-122608]|uniref:hypothetical protein n=1 Tax=Pseudomonas sp. ATCC PTA-122608 TaxID=1771311 RepID=UPI00096B6EA1|nr:hypothetical protein [Pseudomonas sp. ATCC PTA-122608]